MNKERLEEIKENVTVDIVDLVYYLSLDGLIEHWVKSYTLSEGDYRYLIKQAERVEKLEKENKRYREALEEIARGRFPGASYKARKALEDEEELV